jgi:guanosine-3',5'-bis(diphosphate) 3'-pyrophosphohydrolase
MSQPQTHTRSLNPLTWRRPSDVAMAELEPVMRALRKHHGRSEARLVQRAYEFARQAHRDQIRVSGEAFISHPLAVARILAESGFDPTTVSAALLHDVIEDTPVTLDELRAEFGDEIASLVDGVTKLERLRFHSREAQQAATLRKMIIAMASDIRVLVIKIADRLHNMRTVEVLPVDKKRRIAQETLDIYAPLAHRLGMQEFKSELEDLSFKVLHPKRYEEIAALVAERAPEREKYTQMVVFEAKAWLEKAKIPAEVAGRSKHLYSIYEKMVLGGREFDEIYDLVGIRLIVPTVKDCYGALGVIHSLWPPVPGRFKDYIAMPKFNLYQSLHTTVAGPEGKHVEVQIRTPEMHRVAEYGVAAHWQYKTARREHEDDRVWLKSMLEWQEEARSPSDFLESLKLDLYQDAVYVFTPKGDVIELPKGATPVDFAYAIHTEVGHRCVGARVDGKLVSLSMPLRSGSTVEIFTTKDPGAGPSRDWLRFVRTSRARAKIRQYFAKEERDDAIESGKAKVLEVLRRYQISSWKGIPRDAIAQVLKELNYSSEDALLAAVGQGHVSARSVAQRIARRIMPLVEEDELRDKLQRRRSQAHRGPGIRVEGLDDIWVRLAKDCNPIPGDEIVGFVTRGRGVSVHRADCKNLAAMEASAGTGRLVEVEWDHESPGVATVAIQVEALDRKGLLRDVSDALTSGQVNIVACNSRTGPDRIAVLRFEFEMETSQHLDEVLARVRKVSGVFDVYRVLPE